MKISEAIKFIVDQNDKKLLTDSKKFTSYLLDLCSDNPKELKIVKRALEDKILERIFGNERDNVKIARLRDEFEDQGMSEDWSEFVISSFAEALGWNYTPKVQNQQVQSQPQQKQQTNQEQNQPSNQTNWTCSCGTVNNGNFCGNCGKSKPVPKNTSWTCSCGTVNKTKFCTNCGKPNGQQLLSSSNPFITSKVGDFVKFGSYPQTQYGDIKPIEWLVLSRENNQMLVISKYGLEARRFDRISNSWKNSEIRKWLNGDFYNQAFSGSEKKYINYSNLSDVATTDNVFLLSEEEAEKYFVNNKARRCKATYYAVQHGAYVCDGLLRGEGGYSICWLRSPVPDSIDSVYLVGEEGSICYFFYVYHDNRVVRPALWINL